MKSACVGVLSIIAMRGYLYLKLLINSP